MTLLDNCRTIKGIFSDDLRKYGVIYSFGGTVIINNEKIYSFLDFQINPQQRTIIQDNQAIKLSKQSFDMLVVLLQRHGELISKGELMAAVWPNQFINDSALNKQIERLRKSFGNTNEPIIETVRGAGFRLLPDVQERFVDIVKTKSKKSYWPFLIAALLMMLAFSSYHLYQQNPTTTIQTPNKNLVVKSPIKDTPINIAIIPAEKTDDWLNIGGLNYLSELLQKHKNVGAIRPQNSWFKSNDTNIIALQLSAADNIDYTLIVKNILFDNNYNSQLELRDNNGLIAQDNITADSLSLLFERVNSWVVMHINLYEKKDLIGGKIYQEHDLSDYAFESYLKGLAAGRNRNFKEAVDYYNIVINQDNAFHLAWIQRASIETELGNSHKALAALNTVEKMKTFDTSLLNKLYSSKAKALMHLNKLDEADDYLKRSIKFSKKIGDMKNIITALSLQAMIHEKRGFINKQTMSLIEQQLELAKVYEPLPNLIAMLNQNLAIANQFQYNYEKANFHVLKAIEQYKKIDHANGLFSSYRTLSNFHYDQAENAVALSYLEKSENFINSISGPYELVNFYISRARNLTEQGFKVNALWDIEKLNQFATKYDNTIIKIQALTIQAELHLKYNEINLAKSTIEKLLSIIFPKAEDYPADASYVASIDMYIKAKYDSPIIARNTFENYLADYPFFKSEITNELKIIESLILSNEGKKNEALFQLEETLLDNVKKNQRLNASYIGYDILDILWRYDMVKFLAHLNRIEEITTFNYPIKKYRAKYQAHLKDFVGAALSMQELKPKAREFWSIDDQLLLEQYQQMAHNK